MANQYQNTTTNNKFIPVVVARDSLGALENYLNIGKTVTMDAELNPARVGQVLSIPKRGIVVTHDKTQGGEITVQKPTATDVQITVSNHKEVTIGEEDFTRVMQQGGSVLPDYVLDGVMALAEDIETDLLSHTAEFDSANSNIDVASSGDDRYVQGIQQVNTRFMQLKVPQAERRFGYVSPTFIEGLMNTTGAFIDPKIIPNGDALTEGAYGRVRGFDIFGGQLTPSHGSPAKFQNFFYTRKALILASRPLPDVAPGLGVDSSSVMSDAGLALRVQRFYDTKEKATVYSIDCIWGSGVYDVRQGIVLESV